MCVGFLSVSDSSAKKALRRLRSRTVSLFGTGVITAGAIEGADGGVGGGGGGGGEGKKLNKKEMGGSLPRCVFFSCYIEFEFTLFIIAN